MGLTWLDFGQVLALLSNKELQPPECSGEVHWACLVLVHCF